MIPESVLKSTIARFEARTEPRTEAQEKLKSGDRLAADSAERVQKRLARLSLHAVMDAMPVATSAEGVLTQPTGVSPLERVLGRNELMSVTFLERAVRAGRSVARVRIRSSSGQTRGYGTGSLASPRLLLTNNHVLGDVNEAATSLVEFNYQDGLEGATPTPVVFVLLPHEFFVTDRDLDYTLVAVNVTAIDGHSLSDFPTNPLIEEEGKAIVGECLNIIQHPNGEPKQVALRENQLVDVLDNFLHYKTDTAPGSSGSPVFNDQWEIVALHHSGVPKTDAQGRYLTSDGTPWTPAMGEHRIHWIANEGARISRISKHVKNQTLSQAAAKLRAQLFEPAPSAPLERQTIARPQATFKPDGTITWTVPLPPLQISLKVGDMVATPAAFGHVGGAVPRTPPDEPEDQG